MAASLQFEIVDFAIQIKCQRWRKYHRGTADHRSHLLLTSCYKQPNQQTFSLLLGCAHSCVKWNEMIGNLRI